MKALILAGGLGTRLYPLTWGRPKSLVPVCNRAFMERLLSWLRRHGVTEAVLALSHFSHRIEQSLGDGSAWGIRLAYLTEQVPLGSGGAIRNAQHLLGDDSFVVLNGDILTDLDLGDMIRFHREQRAKMTISLVRVADPSAYGVVAMDESKRLLRFVEKPAPGQAPSHYINAGIWLFEPDVLDMMPPPGEPFSVERSFWPACLENGVSMYGYTEECYWTDIGTVSRYLEANMAALTGTVALDIDGSQVAPGVWLGSGARLHPRARLLLPVVIGPEADVGEEAEVSCSVIGPRSVIGSRSAVSGSVLWEGVTVGEGARIVNSVVGAGRQIAAGTSLSGEALPDSGATAPRDE